MVDSEGKRGSFRCESKLEERESDEESTCSSFVSNANSSFRSNSSRTSSVPFKPVNFPPSESFSQKPRFIAETLPGVLPNRATPFDEDPNESGGPNDVDQSLEEHDDGVTLCHCLFAGFVLILSMLIAMIVMRKTDVNYVSNLFMYDFENIETQVNDRVVGQGEAVHAILKALKDMTHLKENSPWCKVLLLIGGPGVGKDFTAHSIKEHFFSIGGEECEKYSHHEFRPLSDSHYCWRRDFNLFTFDTIYSMDDTILQKSIDTLRFITKLCLDYDRKLTVMVPVLPIKAHSIQSLGLKGVDTFSSSSQYLNFVRQEGIKVYEKFKEAGIATEAIFFQPLSWDHAKTCISRSVIDLGRATLSQEAVDEVANLLKPFDHDTDFVPLGCKDVEEIVILLPPKAESHLKI